MATQNLWPVFITADHVRLKKLNKIFDKLYHISPNHHPENLTPVMFALQSSLDPSTLNTSPSTALLTIPKHNDFANLTLSEITTFMHDNSATLSAHNLHTLQWLVIDQNEMDTRLLSCLLMTEGLPADWDGDGLLAGEYLAVRISLFEVGGYAMFLEQEGRKFEDLVDMKFPAREDGTYRLKQMASARPGDDEIRVMEPRLRKGVEEKGFVDIDKYGDDTVADSKKVNPDSEGEDDMSAEETADGSNEESWFGNMFNTGIGGTRFAKRDNW